MMREPFLALILHFPVLLLLASPALATPITLNSADSVAAVRRDLGAGLCGSVVHFKTQAMPLNTVADARALLDASASNPNIVGRTSTAYSNLNFRNNDPSSGGDFTAPGFTDTYLPYSANNQASPPDLTANGDSNIAMRLRGYLNVTADLTGKPLTFAVNCDDFCSLSIGSKSIIPLAHLQIAGRITQQAFFSDPGLYPLELIFAQNTNVAFMELSMAPSAEAEGAQFNGLDTSKFKLLPPAALYSAIEGTAPGCQECGAPGMDCGEAKYCGNGLCQTCNTSDRCGTTCQRCPADKRVCSAGQCIQCANDSQCAAGLVCNTGTCGPAQPCVTSDACRSGQICDSRGLCVGAPSLCSTDADCISSQLCDLKKGVCTSQSACTVATPCEKERLMATGCSASGTGTQASEALALLLGLSTLAALRRRRSSAERA